MDNLVTKSQLRDLLNDIPRGEDLDIALCRLPKHHLNGIDRWDKMDATKALIVFYHARAAQNMERQRMADKRRSTTDLFTRRADEYRRRRDAVQAILNEWEEIEGENHTPVL